MSCSVTVDRSIDVLARAGETEPVDLLLAEVVRTRRGGHSGGEQVEEAVGLEGDDLTADRELAEQQGGPLVRGRGSGSC